MLLLQMSLPLTAFANSGPGTPVSDSGVTPNLYKNSDEYSGGNVACSQLGFSKSSTRNNYNDGFANAWPAGISVTVTSGTYVAWTSTFGIGAVIVKGGPNANVYSYSPQATGDSGLASPINNGGQIPGLSNLTFCWEDESTPTGSIKVSKKVDLGNGYVNDNPSQHGFVWGLNNETPARAMGTTAEDAPVGNNSVTENTVDGYEFTGWYFTNSATYSCNKPRGTTLPVENIQVSEGGTRYVTLCNKKIVEQPRLSTITIVKDAQPNSSQDFEFNIQRVLDGPPGATFFLDDDADGTLPNSWSANNANPGEYKVTETAVDGWVLNGATCTGEGLISQSLDGQVLSFEIESGSNVTCTFVNKPAKGTLKLIKRVNNNWGGKATQNKWTLKATGQTVGSTPQVSGKDTTSNQNTGFTAQVNAGTYRLSEHDGPNGYQLASLKCGTSVDNLTTAANSKVTVANGQTKVCVFTNNDIAPKLTITKEVNNNWGGTLKVKNFPLSVGDISVKSGEANKFSAGWYVIGEIQKPGYELDKTYGDCKVKNGQLMVKLEIGKTYNCTLVNKDKPAKITVTKKVINDNGGKAKAHDFTLKVNHTVVPSGVKKTFNGNLPVTISEVAKSGYEQKSIECYDLTAGNQTNLGASFKTKLGHEYNCTITNDDKPGTLKLIKRVNNNWGGNATQDKWTLKATGLTPKSTPHVSGKDTTSNQNTGFNTQVNAGTYKLSEHGGPNGYQQVSLKCGSDVKNLTTAVNSEVTVANGQTKVCVFTNNDIAPKLTVTKEVKNNWGGTLGVKKFPLYVGDVSVKSGQPNEFKAGWYVIGEIQQPGYELDKASGNCKVKNGQLMVKLEIGKTYNCTLKNKDIPGTITVYKKVINDNGGQKQAHQFDLNIGDKKDVEHGKAHKFKVGKYRISEDKVDGYDLKHIKCYVESNGRAKVSDLLKGKTDNWQKVQPERTYHDGSIKVGLALDQHLTCIVTNDDNSAKLTIEKYSNVDSDKQFQFSGTNGNFSMSAGGKYIASDLSGGTTFNVTENVQDGWKLGGINCYGTESWYQTGNGVSVDLVNGDDVVCKFHNVKLGSISGFKLDDANGNMLEDAGEEKLPGWTITLSSMCAEHNTFELARVTLVSEYEEECVESLIAETETDGYGNYAFTGLTSGWYRVCEVQKDGWTRTFPEDSDCHEIYVGEGEDCIANFANKADDPGQVLSAEDNTLVNTGSSTLRTALMSLGILICAGVVTLLARRRQITE